MNSCAPPPRDPAIFSFRLFAAVVFGMLALISATPAIAASSGWVYAKGGKVRILATPASADGLIRAAVIIDLKPGWTTYWRNPGQTGVPPQLGTDGSRNIRSAELRFPPPGLLDEGGAPAIGYAHSVAFPLSIRQEQAGKASVLKADLFIGMCKEICIPVSASYKLDILPASAAANSPADLPVAAAFAALPPAESRDFAIEAVTLSTDGRALRVKVRLPQSPATGAAPQLFVAGSSGWSFGAGHLTGSQGSAAEFAVPVLSGPDGKSLRGETVDIVVTSGSRSIGAARVAG